MTNDGMTNDQDVSGEYLVKQGQAMAMADAISVKQEAR